MSKAQQLKKLFKKIFRIAGWITASLLVLLLAFIILIRIPAVQERIVQEAVSFLENKIGTPVKLKSIVLTFPKKIVLSDLYLEDQSRDTLLFASELAVDIDMWALLGNKIELNTIQLRNSTVSIRRAKGDGIYNFDYIPKAFASKEASIADTTASQWQFSIERVELNQIKFLYDDKLASDSVNINIGELVLDMDEVDFVKSIYKAKSIDLKNTTAVVQQSGHSNAVTNDGNDSREEIFPFDIDFGNIHLEHVDVYYDQLATNESMQLKLGELHIDANTVDFRKQLLDLDRIDLKETSFVVLEAPSKRTGSQNNGKSASLELNIPWTIRLSKLNLSGNTFRYDNVSEPEVSASIDFNHLLVSFLNARAENIEIKDNSVKIDLISTSFREKSGFSIKSLSTEIDLTEQRIDIRKFLLRSGNSDISLDASSSFESLVMLMEHYERAKLKIDVRQSVISMRDVRFFVPDLIDSLPVYLPSNTTIGIITSLNGSISNLLVNKFLVTAFDSTSLSFHGTLKGLPEIKSTQLDVNIDRFYTTSYDAKVILPDSLLPDSIRLPRWVEIKGKFKGTVQAPDLKASLTSDVGTIDVDGKFDFINTPKYDASVRATELNLGRILRQESSMGTLDLEAKVNGSGDTMENLDTYLDLTVGKFQYNQYDYKDLKVKGSIKKYLFSGSAALKDKNIDLEIKGDLDYRQKLYKLTMTLANADFQALNLSKRPLKARATVDVNLITSDFKVINGNIDIRKVVIFNGKDLYMVDSLIFISLDQKGASKFSIRSDIVSGDFEGTFNLFSLPDVMKQHINHYFSLQNEKVTEFREPQNFKFNLTIKNTDLLTEILFPDLDSFTPGTIKGSFNSETQHLLVDVNLSAIKYSVIGLDSLALNINSDSRALKYSVRLKNLTIDTLHIDDFKLTGRIADDSINTSILVLDSIAKEKYRLGAVITSERDDFRFHLISKRVMLNYVEWNVPDDNYLKYGGRQIVANDFSISREAQQIAVVTEEKDATVSVEFKELQLSNLTRLISGQVPASGQLNGNFKFTTAQQGNFNSRLQIHDLVILGKPLGELTFSLAYVSDRYNLEMLIKSQQTDVKANGYYISKTNASEFSIDVNLDPLDMKSVEPFTFGHLKNVKGYAVGNLKLTGTIKEPSIRGTINFQEVSFLSTAINGSYTLKNEKITFQEAGIEFNNFTIRDQNNQSATIIGSILTKAFRDFEADLRITARNFQILNTEADNKKPYYGMAKINTDTRITGNTNQPTVTMTIDPSDDTNVTYVVPQSAKAVLEQKGIVQWVDRDAISDPFLATLNLTDTIKTENIFRSIDLTANIELTDKETLNIVIDPLTGDKLSVQGNSVLVLEIAPAGDLTLSGRYEITRGSYDFSFYKLVKRKFLIEKGGSISWSGDPMRATLDIRASYTVQTSPLELISNLDPTDAQATNYKQVLPFLVYLKIRGQLLTPEISFALDMPDNKKNVFGGSVYARLQDINTRESELNKQVFALLILKRFIAENPLDNQSASIANTTRQSVSRILSDQLNRLSENVKGVQLNLDIKSHQDYASSSSAGSSQAQGQTKVQLGVTKNLLNDRLIVKLSGNVNIEGQNTTAKGDATDYIGDLALEYKLTSDGRLRITGFRNSNYDIISGELTETGVGLIYVKDLNTLMELFKSNAKPK